MSAVTEFISLCSREGTDVLLHRETGGVDCPCITPEGFRDPAWHAPIEAAYDPGEIPVATLNGAGNVTGSVRYSLGLYWTIPNRPAFHLLSAPSAPIVVANASVSVSFFEFHAADWAPDPVAALVLYRSIDNGPWVEIGSWVDVVPPVIDNAVVNWPGAAPIDPPPLCNAAGKLPAVVQDLNFKGFVQPIQSTRATRLSDERLPIPRGEVQADDHLGIFPVTWLGQRLNFYPWPEAGQDYVEYNGRRFHVVNSNLLPGPGGKRNTTGKSLSDCGAS